MELCPRRGLLKVDAHKTGQNAEVTVNLLEGMEAWVSVPGGTEAMVDGKWGDSMAAEAGTRRMVTLAHAGRYVVSAR